MTILKKIEQLELRVSTIEKTVSQSTSSATTTVPKTASKKVEEDDDDGVDLFASDSEEEAEAAKVREERLAAYNEKKSKSILCIT